jgi:hypothetical protein
MSDYIGNRPAPVPLTADQIAPALAASGVSSAMFRNRVINGCARIIQRGSNTVANSGQGIYGPDRWYFYNGSGGTLTAAQAVSTAYGGAYACQLTGPTFSAAGIIDQRHRIEAINIEDLAGKVCTLSFYAAAAVTGGGFAGNIYIGTASARDNYTTINYIGPTAFAITGAQTKFTYTFTMPAGATNGVEILIRLSKDATAGTNVAYVIGSLQLEEGSVATPFERRPYGLELYLCRRYFQRIFYPRMSGMAGSTTTAWRLGMPLSQQMRAVPTVAFASVGIQGVAGGQTINAINSSYHSVDSIEVDCTAGGAFATAAGQAVTTFNNGAAGYIDVAAEL